MGVLFSAFGVALAWGAAFHADLAMASFWLRHSPIIAGLLVALLGVGVTLDALAPETRMKAGPACLKPLAAILGANVAFGVLLGGVPCLGIPPMGIVVAIYLIGFAIRLSACGLDLRAWGMLAIVLSLGGYLAHVLVPGLHFPVWPTFIPF